MWGLKALQVGFTEVPTAFHSFWHAVHQSVHEENIPLGWLTGRAWGTGEIKYIPTRQYFLKQILGSLSMNTILLSSSVKLRKSWHWSESHAPWQRNKQTNSPRRNYQWPPKILVKVPWFLWIPLVYECCTDIKHLFHSHKDIQNQEDVQCLFIQRSRGRSKCWSQSLVHFAPENSHISGPNKPHYVSKWSTRSL